VLYAFIATLALTVAAAMGSVMLFAFEPTPSLTAIATTIGLTLAGLYFALDVGHWQVRKGEGSSPAEQAPPGSVDIANQVADE
jgi:hypothetical protein